MIENSKQQELKVYLVKDDIDRIIKTVNKELFFEQFDPRFERLSGSEQEAYGMFLQCKERDNYMMELAQALNSGLAKTIRIARTLRDVKYTMQGIPIKDLAAYSLSLNG